MKKYESAEYYLDQYEDTDVIITAVNEFDGGVVFDLSDGTHWFADDNDNYQVSDSLIGTNIGWDDGWVIINDDGSISRIGWC